MKSVVKVIASGGLLVSMSPLAGGLEPLLDAQLSEVTGQAAAPVAAVTDEEFHPVAPVASSTQLEPPAVPAALAAPTPITANRSSGVSIVADLNLTIGSVVFGDRSH